jgi:hypothetical protein
MRLSRTLEAKLWPRLRAYTNQLHTDKHKDDREPGFGLLIPKNAKVKIILRLARKQ